MTKELESSIVRLFKADSMVVGAGFFLGKRSIITCAHVVAQAFDLVNDCVERPEGVISLDFPLVAPGLTRTAHIVFWLPPQEDEGGDIAGLELDQDPPSGVQAAPIAKATNWWGHSFSTFGFPDGQDSGVWATGILRGRQATHWVMIEDVKKTGFPVEPGFSGAPVWDDQLQCIVGMVVASVRRKEVKAAFVIPVDVLGAAWPVFELIPPFIVAEKGITWDTLKECAQKRSQRFLKDAQGQSNRRGSFIPEIYVRDEDVEQEQTRFLKSDATALIIVGDSGIGKTNLICWWTKQLMAAGHLVFPYHCGTFYEPAIEHEIARDLLLHLSDDLFPVLKRICYLARRVGQQCVFIFDAINEFHGEGNIGPEAILKRINTLVDRLPDGPMRIVFTCRTYTWRHLYTLNATKLFVSRYLHFSSTDELALFLKPFNDGRLDEAYTHYQNFFRLQTPLVRLPQSLKERLRDPLMLRLLAETYQDRDEQIPHETIALSLFQRFYRERVNVRLDQVLLDELVREMLHQRRSTFSVEELIENEHLRSDILQENEEMSSYYRLIDRGVLIEQSSDSLTGGAIVKFSSDRLGGFILAYHLLRKAPPTIDLIVGLIEDAPRFPLAWDTATILLALRKDVDLFTGLAESTNVTLRELAVRSLVEIYNDEPALTITIVKKLLQMDSQEVRRTALKAAYYIGPRAKDIFLWAAISGTSALRKSTSDVLYLIWRTDPRFTYDLLRELTGRIVWIKWHEALTTIEFVLDLLITIYISHCHDEYVVEQTSEIFYDMAKNRLHLHRLQWLTPETPDATGIRSFLFNRVEVTFSKPILEVLLSSSQGDQVQHFFQLSFEERTPLRRIAPFLDPHTDVNAVKDDILALLTSDTITKSNLAILPVLVLSVHAYSNFENVKPLLWSLSDQLSPRGHLWLLLTFLVLLPDTPPAWAEIVEDFTRTLFEEHQEIFHRQEPSLLDYGDIAFLPLGLVHGKLGQSIPYVESVLRHAYKQSNRPLLMRCIEALGIVGFYYPKTLFSTLQAAIPDLANANVDTALVKALSTARVSYVDEVDVFLHQMGASETLQQDVARYTDVESASRYIRWLGLYNNAVHLSVFHPRMRQRFAIEAFNLLVEVSSPKQFLAHYTLGCIRLAYETDFQLRRWTLPGEQ